MDPQAEHRYVLAVGSEQIQLEVVRSERTMFAHIPLTVNSITKANVLKMTVFTGKGTPQWEVEVDAFLLSIGGKVIRGYYHVHDVLTQEVVDQM